MLTNLTSRAGQSIYLLNIIATLSGRMIVAVYARSQDLRSRLSAIWTEIAEAEADAEEEKKGLSTIAIVLIVGAVLLLCVVPICVIVLLALSGPAIGNVFSGITEGI